MKPRLLDTPMGVVSMSSFTGLNVAPARIESTSPNAFRVAQYPDGDKRIQGAYAWSEGSIGGFEWRDLPLVYVDMVGKEYAT